MGNVVVREVRVMDSLWEPLPSDVADWMGMESVAHRTAPPIARVRAPARRGFAARLAGLRRRLFH